MYIKLFLILYADDTALMAESSDGLLYRNTDIALSDSNCYNKCNEIKVNNDQFNQTDDQDNHKLNETCLNRQASNYCTFDNLSETLPYLEIPVLIHQQKCNQQNISSG